MNKTSLKEKFAMIQEHWRPKVVARLNGHELKLVKFAGVFRWHHHEHADEMFLLWRGQMTIWSIRSGKNEFPVESHPLSGPCSGVFNK